jgi:hypothetical protein
MHASFCRPRARHPPPQLLSNQKSGNSQVLVCVAFPLRYPPLLLHQAALNVVMAETVRGEAQLHIREPSKLGARLLSARDAEGASTREPAAESPP